MLASYRAREGHPLVFARALFGQLAVLQGDKAAWKIVDARRAGSARSRSIARTRATSTRGRSTKPRALLLESRRDADSRAGHP